MSRHKSLFRLVAFIAFVLSITFHVVAMGFNSAEEELVAIEGGAEQQVAALGSNFQDLVKSGDTLSPLDTELSEPIEAAENTKNVETLAETEPVEAKQDVTEPQVTRPQNVVTPTALVAVDPQAPGPRIVPVTPVENMEIASVSPVQPTQVVEAAPELPVPTARPFRQIDKDRAEQAERERKNAQAEARKRKEKKKAAEKKPATGRKQANAKSNASKGTSDGRKNAKPAQSAQKSGTKSVQAGNAAVSNYPGKVYRKIARTRQKKVGGKGTVRVRFSILPSGGISNLSVAGSSGNAQIDSAALNHVKRAAPFAKPPAGAQRNFVIPIEFRR